MEEPKDTVEKNNEDKTTQAQSSPIIVNQDILGAMTDRDKRILFSNLMVFIATQLAALEGVSFSNKEN